MKKEEFWVIGIIFLGVVIIGISREFVEPRSYKILKTLSYIVAIVAIAGIEIYVKKRENLASHKLSETLTGDDIVIDTSLLEREVFEEILAEAKKENPPRRKPSHHKPEPMFGFLKRKK